MKKLFLLFIALCALTVAQAQVVSSYTMQATQGTYTEITDGTVMDLTGLDLTVEDPLTGVAWYPHGIVTESTTAAGFPIGFDFTFNDMACNQFIIGANGYIALGRDEITNDPSHKQHIVSREEGADNTMGILPNNFSSGIWVNDSSEYSYKVIGEAPNRTLVVQFKNWAPNFGYDAEEVASMNMQIRLNETSNTIEFVLGELVYNSDVDRMTRIALRGYYQDLLCLRETTDEDVDPETVAMIDWVAVPEDYQVYLGAGMVTSGLTYTFTPPADCVEPSSSFTCTGANIKTNSFSMEWDWADFSDADHVLLSLLKSGTREAPVDGVYYTAGDSLGDALVLAYTTDTIYEMPEDIQLEPSTDYFLYVYLANSFCSNGPVYNSGWYTSFTTKPAMPESIEITNTTTNTLTFNVEANDVDEVFVIITDSIRPNPPYVNVIEFGEPIGYYYNVGDYVGGIGRVAYIGPSAENIVVEGLEAGTTYYLRAHSLNRQIGYSSEVVETSDITIATLPWKLDLSNTNKQEIPVGWTSVGSNKQLVATAMKSGYGEESLQFSVQIQPNTTNGHTTELTSPYIIIDKENALFSFEYNMNTPGNWGMAGTKYDEWNEKDTFAIQVSRNGGAFETVTLVNSTNNVKVDAITQFVPVTADLSAYLNDTIQLRFYWNCYSSGKVRLTLEKWNIDEYIAPATPEVKVENITHLSAKVTWRSEQENYEVAYAKTGEEFVTVLVEGASEYDLTELEAETEYQVKVRGIVAEGEYSAWSEVVTFTTTAWPECDAPTDLAAAVEGKTATLTWEGTEDHLTWEVRYRDANSTTWITIEGLEEPTTVLENLEEGVTYLWNVRAYCTAGRETAWSAQATFTTGPTVPAAPVVTGSFEGDIISLEWEAVPGALTYKLYYGGTALTEPFEETRVDIQVPSVGTYCFTVTALNEVGESAHSDEVCVTVTIDPDMTAPEAPELVATLEGDKVVLTWEAVEGATYYDVYIYVPEGEDQYLGTATMEDLPIKMQLPEYGEYCFYVIAANLAGESEPSNIACVNYGSVGIEENEVVFNIYPNPVNDKLVIETEATIEEICIYDAFGRLMEKVNETTTIDVSEYNAGVYIMKVRTDNGEVVKRFVKK